ncbi:MAG TPA: PhoH family protein, partial [Methylomirabilota bacterium]|nr:PhoH family protein [Methylomirabilota bacterium]
MPDLIVTRRILLAPAADQLSLLGRNDEHLRLLESQLGLKIVARGNEVILEGSDEQVAKAERLLGEMQALVQSGAPLANQEVKSALRILADDPQADLTGILRDAIQVPSRKKLITAKSVNQKRYLDAIRQNDIVMAIGVAGTGKSFLGVAMAVSTLMKREVSRIVLTRPAVEAGERL